MMKHLFVVLVITPLCAQMPDQLEAHGVLAAKAMYQGKSAVRLDALPNAADGTSFAIVKGSRFHNGSIEVELAGKPAVNAGPGARGFIGVAFRVQGNRYECTSTSGRRMGGRTTRCAGTIRPNTVRNRSSVSTACARNPQRSTNRMWTWSPECGRSTGS